MSTKEDILRWKFQTKQFILVVLASLSIVLYLFICFTVDMGFLAGIFLLPLAFVFGAEANEKPEALRVFEETREYKVLLAFLDNQYDLQAGLESVWSNYSSEDYWGPFFVGRKNDQMIEAGGRKCLLSKAADEDNITYRVVKFDDVMIVFPDDGSELVYFSKRQALEEDPATNI